MSAKPLEKKQCMKQITLAAYAAAVFALLGAVWQSVLSTTT
jgi:hypothetical protein